ncbi:thiol-disulfide oxidoreductase DCC family protein [Crocinitomix catalasitica]|uniref:thiol-disulfide oxidoreductase DCC family protein n=1 Tax=Crocinitomix catalasitica TaxID=184607 RepID=UPI000484A9AC|nr:DUF393 domain-containing protein [Crocinitomix catalasitica]
MKENQNINPVVFYDGECGFCNISVQFINKHKKQIFYFAALQSEFAKTSLDKHNLKINLDTIYFLKNNKVYDRSSAVLQICLGLKGAYPLLFSLYIVPKFIRDPFYNFVAKRRHKIQSKSCALPSLEERKYFILD